MASAEVGWVSSRVGELLGGRSLCLLGIESAMFVWLGWGSQIGVRNENGGTMGGDCTMLCFDQLQECEKRGTYPLPVRSGASRGNLIVICT